MTAPVAPLRRPRGAEGIVGCGPPGVPCRGDRRRPGRPGVRRSAVSDHRVRADRALQRDVSGAQRPVARSGQAGARALRRDDLAGGARARAAADLQRGGVPVRAAQRRVVPASFVAVGSAPGDPSGCPGWPRTRCSTRSRCRRPAGSRSAICGPAPGARRGARCVRTTAGPGPIAAGPNWPGSSPATRR